MEIVIHRHAHNGSLEARNLHYSLNRGTSGSHERQASDYLRLVTN